MCGLASIAQGLGKSLHMGNLDDLRDGGCAKCRVRLQWMLQQQPQADDVVMAAGVQCSVREFVTRFFFAHIVG